MKLYLIKFLIYHHSLVFTFIIYINGYHSRIFSNETIKRDKRQIFTQKRTLILFILKIPLPGFVFYLFYYGYNKGAVRIHLC